MMASQTARKEHVMKAVAKRQERGIVLVTTLMLMMLMAALIAGFSVAVVSDQQFRGVDKERATAFYSSHSGLEKLTADLGGLFAGNFAPNGAQVNGLEAASPSLPGIQFVAADGGNGYDISFEDADADGDPDSVPRQIENGPFEGLMGQVTRYWVDVTARTETGSDVHLQREMQTVTIPIFQFGTFSDMDLGFHSAAAFDFGGRVHANGNLYLKANSTLWLRDKVTTAGEIIRKELMNGYASGYTGPVNVLKAPGSYRDLQENEGSLVAGIGSAQNEPTWTNLSIGTYNGNIRSSRTGGKRLDLPLITVGGTPIDLIRRPGAVDEDTANPTLFNSRYFAMASLRILLSDTAADITNLPTVTAQAPISLDWTGGVPAQYNGGVIDANNPPLAVAGLQTTGVPATNGATQLRGSSNDANNYVQVDEINRIPLQTPGGGIPDYYSFFINGRQVHCTGTATNNPLQERYTGCTGHPDANDNTPVETGYRVPTGGTLHNGFIKIEKQDVNGVWTDVTGEILSLGIAGRNLRVGGCAEPNPNAILRLQRLTDQPSTTGIGNNCGNGSTIATDYIPNSLFDPREGNRRDHEPTGSSTVYLGGVMHYIELDVNNLRRWWEGTIGISGPGSMDVTGYVVYFSDRRGNRDAGGNETGEFGFEDFVNPTDPAVGNPNGVLDAGEDMNANGTLETYGAVPIPRAGAFAPLDGTADLRTAVNPEIARVNPPVFFRRALKLTNGSVGNIIMPGLTVVAENTLYVEGNYNASNGGFVEPNAATAVIVDSLSLLSNAWNDLESYDSPQQNTGRVAQETWWRMAVISGKGNPFPRPNGEPANLGTDGGIHNFLRYIERWSGKTVHYLGSIAILYNNRQNVGIFKQAGNNNVYGPPSVRDYSFDLDFLDPSLMPPRTPVFRDINTLGFTEITGVGQ
jgi:hypothetical protein